MWSFNNGVKSLGNSTSTPRLSNSATHLARISKHQTTEVEHETDPLVPPNTEVKVWY